MATGEVYLLFLIVKRPVRIKVGSLGEIEFSPGEYVYVGRAKKNIVRRLERHFSRVKKARWHIDYLTSHPSVEVRGAVILPLPATMEETVAEELQRRCYTVAGFGSSDTSARGHLFHNCHGIEEITQNGVEFIPSP